MRIALFLCALWLPACSPIVTIGEEVRGPNCIELAEMQRLLAAFEANISVVEVGAEACYYGVEVAWIEAGEVNRVCGQEAWGCYWDDRVLVVRMELEGSEDGDSVLRHEALHRLLQCSTGDEDYGHSHEAWRGLIALSGLWPLESCD